MEGYCSTGQSPQWAVVPMGKKKVIINFIFTVKETCEWVVLCAFAACRDINLKTKAVTRYVTVKCLIVSITGLRLLRTFLFLAQSLE